MRDGDLGAARPPSDPLWYRDAVIYQLHLKSFFDANDDGVGDIPGLIRKLDYIQSLGVTAIWLLPFYPSPRRDDGYDIADYRGVHADYGSLRDVKRLIDAAHARGLRVITELVINHTSDQHPWFQRARTAPTGSRWRDYYVWSDTDQAFGDTRIIFLDTEKSNWAWDTEANAYYWHRFYSHQPDLNFDNPHVVRSILNVLHFWLKMGIDGLRLDAVPYLCEREGTNNENLPETHAILKRIRAELDSHYADRMLLAEANQWPEDVLEYFGDGDECHMAFHFPLMPRMYMAIAQEDRHPITDILRQTPDIPNGCQWAVFLRNHDELTLEMVTDRERDYLWDVYANDRRARINLGIRRRLAPLMENDRRRIELMNSLLLSMPGTPVIYYGDEIGMGDNIYLGDRDGVRTPMQWDPDRNGGFSRANPARLVLPPIMDPVYGYEAVNVEAQAGDPHSLLNWMRRMLAVRQAHQAFGRGGFRLLYPGNRKVLAYLRQTDEETILCVANVSRTAQAVELDLAGFSGHVPVELLGGMAFPPIGELPYLLTLQPYGFFWFTLAVEAVLPHWHQPAPEPMPEYQTIVLRDGWRALADGPERATLETQVLPAYLPVRRWFGGKDTGLKAARLAVAVPMPGLERDALLAMVTVEREGGTEDYFLPLGLAWEEDSPLAVAQQLALARVRRGRRVAMLTDAIAIDTVVLGMVERMREGAVVEADGGTLSFQPTSRFADLPPAADTEIRRLAVEQSNTSVIVSDQAVLKLIRRPVRGDHPEAEMTRHLTEETDFANAPTLLGTLTWAPAAGAPMTLALLHGFVRNQGDGWTWSLDALRRAVQERMLLAGIETAEPESEGDLLGPYVLFAEAIGRRLAELHLALARPSDDPAFAPEPIEPEILAGWASGIAAEAETALARLAGLADRLDEELRPVARRLAGRRRALAQRLRRLGARRVRSTMTRIHGDLHLGQILVVQGDAVIIDFEGEPARPLAERRAKSSPLRDVAGVLRSFDYLAAALDDEPVSAPADGAAQRRAVARRWIDTAAAAFLASYRATARGCGSVPRADVEFERLLGLFLVQKACYELAYEIKNRPHWIGLPVVGLDRLVGQMLPVRDAG